MSPVEWTEEEIEQQKKELYNREETIEQKVKIEQPNLRLRKEIKNLLCLHKNTKEQNGYIVCTDCNTKWKVKNNG